jgi:hypothetical protein
MKRALIIAVLAVALGAALTVWAKVGRPRLWHQVGPIQVLGGPEEAWVFVEKELVAEPPGWGWGEQRFLSLGCNQEVVVINSRGVQRRITIPEGKEVTFHENISRIFRQEDGFYLLRGSSMGWHGSIFKWEENHFRLLPLHAYGDFLKAQGLEHSNVPEFDPAIGRLTEKNNWKHLLAERLWILAPFGFTWNGQRFEIIVRQEPTSTKLIIRSLQPGNQWEAVLLEIDPSPKRITRQEYRKLWDSEEPGYRKSD